MEAPTDISLYKQGASAAGKHDDGQVYQAAGKRNGEKHENATVCNQQDTSSHAIVDSGRFHIVPETSRIENESLRCQQMCNNIDTLHNVQRAELECLREMQNSAPNRSIEMAKQKKEIENYIRQAADSVRNQRYHF